MSPSTIRTKRIVEARIDEVILDILVDDVRGKRFLEELGFPSDSVESASTQKRHFGTPGSIDIYVRTSRGAHLLIENKIGAPYSVTRDLLGQPERYQTSVAKLQKYGDVAWSVLTAPDQYLRSTSGLEKFDKNMSYETLVKIAAPSDADLLQRAIVQAATPYEPVAAADNMRTFSAIYELAKDVFPDLHLKISPNAGGVRPKESQTVYVDVPRTLIPYEGVPRPRMSLQLRETGAKIMLPDLGRAASQLEPTDGLLKRSAYFASAGKSLGIKIDTQSVSVDKPFNEQVEEALSGLSALDRLREWWNKNRTEVQTVFNAATQILAAKS